MRVAYFDCFSGASGDMLLAACIGAGVDADVLRADLAGLGVGGFSIDVRQVVKQGFAATQVEVRVDATAHQPHRHLKHLREILESSTLSEAVRGRALSVFTRLAEAEARVHGTTAEKVHFHEVGAVDAIVDVVGACLALDRLGVDRVYASAIPTGSGTVQCDHGLMPVPAPATAELLKGVPLAECDEPGELTTPTGAAILTALASGFGPIPGMAIEHIGIGAGRREGKRRANILRLIVGEAPELHPEEETDEVVVLEANLDDVSAEVIGYVYERLLAGGALDVFTSPIYMKKNRPATHVTVLASPALCEEMEDILFSETTTFGIRTHLARRRKLSRTVEKVETAMGVIGIKVGRRGGRVLTASPEFEDCRLAAMRTGRPLKEVMETALRVWREGRGGQ